MTAIVPSGGPTIAEFIRDRVAEIDPDRRHHLVVGALGCRWITRLRGIGRQSRLRRYGSQPAWKGPVVLAPVVDRDSLWTMPQLATALAGLPLKDPFDRLADALGGALGPAGRAQLEALVAAQLDGATSAG